MRKRKSNRSTKSKYLLAGLTMSSALVLARPIIPAVVYATDANKYSWTKQNLDLIGNETFNRAASSKSGSDIIVSSVHAYDGTSHPSALYISHNFGETWQNAAEIADPGINNYWGTVDISNDGQTMVASSRNGVTENSSQVNGKILISDDAGVTWSDITSDIPLDGGESRVVLSGDGNTLAVPVEKELYVSENKGDTWTSQTILGGGGWSELGSLSMSDNGEKLLVGTAGSGTEFDGVFLSEDSGDTWDGLDLPIQGSLAYPTTYVSPNGGKIGVTGITFIGGENDYVFTSNNDGATWSDITPDDDAWNIWTSLDMSDDGKKAALLGVAYEPATGGEDVSMYVSDNSGAKWKSENVDAGNKGSLYDFYGHSNVDLNSDGSRAIVARVGGVYTGIERPSVNLTDAEGGKTITITTPDGTTITCSSAVKESAQAEQDSSYSYPLGLVNFCFDTESEDNEVSLTFVTDLKPNEVKARKYNSDNQTYFDIPNATIAQTTISGKPALTLTYTITDNGRLDLNPENGKIADPVGLALVGGLAPTGQSQVPIYALVGVLTLPATVHIVRRKLSQQHLRNSK